MTRTIEERSDQNKTIPVNSDVVGWIVDDVDNHGVTVVSVDCWPRQFSVDRRDDSAFA